MKGDSGETEAEIKLCSVVQFEEPSCLLKILIAMQL